MKKSLKQQLDKRIAEEIRLNHIPGIIGGTYVDGKEIEYFCYGKADISTGMELKKDTIFRLYSMSKPVCAVAAWILIDRRQIHLEDPIGKFLPEYMEMNCLKKGQVVPANNQIRIRDLLNMTAGLTYDDDDAAGRPICRFIERLHQSIDNGKAMNTQEVVRELAEYPLAFTQGERWRYGLCADVLGAVIEVVSGRSLGRFYQEEIFEPLGMLDTGFYVPKEKQNRFAPLYKKVFHHTTEECILQYDTEHHLGLGDFKTAPAFESAGAGLVSTYNDYMRFAQMLASCGELDGIRILNKDTVKQFTQNQLSKEQVESIYFDHINGYGYGNLMRVCLDDTKALIPGRVGSFGWDGWCGPYMTVDLNQKKSVVFFIQVAAYSDWELNACILDGLLNL